MTVRDLSFSKMVSIKLLSNFTTSKSFSAKAAILENPLPKSSKAILKPAAWKSSISLVINFFSRPPILSVISISISCGPIWYLLQIATAFCTTFFFRKVVRDILTDTLINFLPCFCQLCIYSQTVSRTKKSTKLISPFCSNSGIKSIGGTRLPLPFSFRTKASAPFNFSSLKFILGCK